MKNKKYYPINVDISNQKCVVVGCGPIGERKALSLADCGACVVVVSKSMTPAIERLAGENKLLAVRRGFVDSDVEGAFLVYSATNDAALNERIFNLARKRGILVNVVDRPEICNFIVPAVLRRGAMTLAVSTSGAAPSLSKRIKAELEAAFPENYGDFIDFLSEKREVVRNSFSDAVLRGAIFKSLAESEELKKFCLGGDMERAELTFDDILKIFFDKIKNN